MLPSAKGGRREEALIRTSCYLAIALLAYGSQAFAQDFPTRFVTIVAPFQAGGPSDTVARLIAVPMSKALGQQVVVENVTGAGGTLGSGRVAKAAPDGYTLGISGSGTHAAVEQLYANPPYRALDFEWVGLVNTTPVVIVGKKDFPPNSLQELVAYLRANEKTVTEADAGVGSVSHLACSVFHSLIGIKPTVVSYRGTPQATQDVLAGNVDFLCNQIVNIVEHAKAGSLKAYAVTGETRSAMLPNVPTTTEAGLPDFKLTVWYGLSAPKGTPAPIVAKLNQALSVAMDDPIVVKRFADLGYDVAPPQQRSPAAFEEFMRKEVDLWARVLGSMKPATAHDLAAGARDRDHCGHAARRRSRPLGAGAGQGDHRHRASRCPGAGRQCGWGGRAQGMAPRRAARPRRPCDRDQLAQHDRRLPDRRDQIGPGTVCTTGDPVQRIHRVCCSRRLEHPRQRRPDRRPGEEHRHDRALHVARQFQSRRGSEGDPPRRRRHPRGEDPCVRYRPRRGRGRGCRPFRCRCDHGGERRARTRGQQ